MKLMLDAYTKVIGIIYEYFGFKMPRAWRDLPIEDATMLFWYLDQDENSEGYVVFAEDEATLMDKTHEDCYANKIHTHKDFHQKVYRSADYTMVVIKQAGWEFLQVLDNAKERQNFRKVCHLKAV